MSGGGSSQHAEPERCGQSPQIFSGKQLPSISAVILPLRRRTISHLSRGHEARVSLSSTRAEALPPKISVVQACFAPSLRH